MEESSTSGHMNDIIFLVQDTHAALSKPKLENGYGFNGCFEKASKRLIVVIKSNIIIEDVFYFIKTYYHT